MLRLLVALAQLRRVHLQRGRGAGAHSVGIMLRCSQHVPAIRYDCKGLLTHVCILLKRHPRAKLRTSSVQA